MTRRDFHRRSAAPFCISNLLDAFSGTQYPWKLGVITDQVDFDLSRALRSFFPKYQLRWAEIRYLDLGGRNCYAYADATPAQLKQVRKQLEDAAVRLSVLDTAIYKVTLPGTTPVGKGPAYVDADKGGLNRQLDDLKRAADAAHALGADRIRIFTFRRVADPSTIFEHILEHLHKAIEVAAGHDITLLVENEYDCNIGTGAETAQLFKAIPNRRLMHNWDPCNAYEMGEQPFPKVWDQLDHSRISHIHLKDARGKNWKPIGSGDINFAAQFQALKVLNYSGTLSLETRYKDVLQDQYGSSVQSMNGLMEILGKI